MDTEEKVRLPIGNQYGSFRTYILRAAILPIIPLSLYWSGLGFIARQWVGNSPAAGVSFLIFLATPFLSFFAWRLNRFAGLCLFLAFFTSVWIPPWVVSNTQEMFRPTIVGLLLMVVWGIACLTNNPNKGLHA